MFYPPKNLFYYDISESLNSGLKADGDWRDSTVLVLLLLFMSKGTEHGIRGHLFVQVADQQHARLSGHLAGEPERAGR